MSVRKPEDPRNKYPRPPFPSQDQEPPGSDQEMQPKADLGAETYRGCGRLEGKMAVITGGDSGIGAATAIAFAREGADIAISYLKEHTDAENVAAEVEKAGRRCLLFPGDIGGESHCRSIVERVKDEFDRLDILVNNAAFQKVYKSITEISAEDLEKPFRTNLFSMFYFVKAALPQMNNPGSIINTASIQAYRPDPGLMAYAATKAAIVNFTKSLAREAVKSGVRVNAVAPGPIWTPLIPSTMPEGRVEGFGGNTPMGRPAQPVEVAPVFVFLASDEASYVTGHVYGVTGGEGWP